MKHRGKERRIMTSAKFLELGLNEVRDYIESCRWRDDKSNSWHFGITRLSIRPIDQKKIVKFPSMSILYDQEWKRWIVYVSRDMMNYTGFFFMVSKDKITVTGVMKVINGECKSVSYECC